MLKISFTNAEVSDHGYGLYIFLPTFLEDLRDNYDNKDPEFDEILRMIKTCRLLIIDDIGAERVTDWVRERMEPYRRADVWHNWLDRYVKKTICNECLKKYDVGGKQ